MQPLEQYSVESFLRQPVLSRNYADSCLMRTGWIGQRSGAMGFEISTAQLQNKKKQEQEEAKCRLRGNEEIGDSSLFVFPVFPGTSSIHTRNPFVFLASDGFASCSRLALSDVAYLSQQHFLCAVWARSSRRSLFIHSVESTVANKNTPFVLACCLVNNGTGKQYKPKTSYPQFEIQLYCQNDHQNYSDIWSGGEIEDFSRKHQRRGHILLHPRTVVAHKLKRHQRQKK